MVNKQPGPTSIRPSADGWRVERADSAPVSCATLEEAAAAVTPGAAVELDLPCRAVLFERMRLPTVEPSEVRDMARLQLEKSLPFPPEEVSSDFVTLSTSESETAGQAVAVHLPQLDTVCQPLLTRGLYPQKLGLMALRVAAACPADRLVLVVYREVQDLVFGVCENGRLTYAFTLPVAEPDAVAAELPQALLSAEMDGVSIEFAEIHLDERAYEFRDTLADFLHVPVVPVALDGHLPPVSLQLLPDAWRDHARRTERRARLRGQLLIAAGVYGLALLAASGYLLWQQNRVDRLGRQLAATAPQIEFVQSRKARWDALAPAIDPRRYPVEVLNQICQSLPSEDFRITKFDQGRDQFMLEAEAPSANEAIEFGEKLKENPALKGAGFTISYTPPTILPNDHAQVRVFGKP
jgi:hypothetical protein